MPIPLITVTSLTLDTSSSLADGRQQILADFPTSSETAPAELHAALDDLWARLTGHESSAQPRVSG